jgi:hypothetical protein
VVAALAVAGCGGDDGGDATTTAAAPKAAVPTTPAPAQTTTTTTPAAGTAEASHAVARAATQLDERKAGVAVSTRGEVVTNGQTTTVKGKGVVNRANGRGAFKITTVLSGTPIVVREVSDGRAVYFTGKVFANRLPGGRSWMKIDLVKAAEAKGFDPSTLGTNGPSQDPSQVLDYLKGATAAKKVGTEEIRGVPTTHYRFDADLDKAIARSRSKLAKATLGKLQSTLGGAETIPVDVWLDARHRVLRERVRYTATIKGLSSALDFTTDFSHFGVPVKVDTPPASDTVDGLKLLEQANAAKQQQQNG